MSDQLDLSYWCERCGDRAIVLGRSVLAGVDRLREALAEIADLDDVRADEAAGIARRALSLLTPPVGISGAEFRAMGFDEDFHNHG